MPNLPVPCSKETLLAILDDIRAHVEAGDSMEGSLEYLMPFDEQMEIIEGADFVVRAAYRIGNSMGQGGMRIIGSLTADAPKTPPAAEPATGEPETEDG